MSSISQVTSQARPGHGELRTLWLLALPLIFGQLSTIGMNVIDAALAGHFGAATLAAVGVGTNVWSLCLVTGIGVMLALPPSVAHLVGAGEQHRVGALFRQALWLALALGLALLFATRHTEPLLRALGIEQAIVADTQKFLSAIGWGAPALTGFFALRGLSEGIGLTRPTLYFSFLGLLLLGPIGYSLMYGAFGLPPRGAQGSGIATAIVLWLQFAAFAAYIATRRHYCNVTPFARFDAPDLRAIAALLRLGVPMCITLLMEAGLFVTAGLLMATLGTTVIDGHQIAVNVASFTFMLPLGLAMATTVRVGQAAGAGDYLRVRRAGYFGIGSSLLTQAVSSVCMAAFPNLIVAFYTNDADVRALAAQLLVLAAIFQFSDGIQVTANGALRGLKDTTIPMLITTLAYWGVGMPLGWWLGFHNGMGAPGMWIGLIGGLTAAAALLLARFARLARRSRVS
jgi:MATE family multidrug resistance protein